MHINAQHGMSSAVKAEVMGTMLKTHELDEAGSVVELLGPAPKGCLGSALALAVQSQTNLRSQPVIARARKGAVCWGAVCGGIQATTVKGGGSGTAQCEREGEIGRAHV